MVPSRGRARACGPAPAARPGTLLSQGHAPVTQHGSRQKVRFLTDMESIIVRGGRPLSGEVRVEGAKNSALKLMAASLLAPGTSRITNVPQIADVDVMTDVLARLGAKVVRTDHALEIDASNVDSYEAPYELVAQMRASTSVLGPLIARFGQARVAMPGGCNIGSRKIDMHIRGLAALGVDVHTGHGYIDAKAPEGGMHGAAVTLDFPSVGATENLITSAAVAHGTTIISNAAREPEIVDLCEFLNGMGAHISGAARQIITVEAGLGAAPGRAPRRRRPD